MADTNAEKRTDLAYLYDDRFLLHDPGNRHPESPLRLIAVRDALEASGVVRRWQKIEARPASLQEIELIHHPGLVRQIELASKRAPAHLDPDTAVSADSYNAALLAAGGVIEMVDAICSGRLHRGFAFVRPPGHHAEPDRAMGFCLLNNIAIGAAYARRVHDLERVAVIDPDLHHGNGSQVSFYDDPHVLYVSSHQFPFYPGTGDFGEIGVGDGKGYTVNFPLPEGTGDGTFVPLYSNIVGSILDQYAPQLILVSIGFDAHFRDPLGGLIATNAGFASIAASLVRAAERNCHGRICFVLEGGYSMDALRDCTKAVMSIMEQENPPEATSAINPLFQQISERTRGVLGDFWKW
jgi:acetoin utilization deacetylase AcuC-like enzyme